MRRPWTPERNELLREAVRVHQPKDGAGWRQVGTLCGCSDRAAQVQWGRIRDEQAIVTPKASNRDTEECITHTPSPQNTSPEVPADQNEVTHSAPLGSGPLTEADLVQLFHVDLTKWEPVRLTHNKWEAGAKGPEGDILTVPLFQTTLTCKRIPGGEELNALGERLLAAMRDASPSGPAILRVKADLLMEVDAPDLHLGKVATKAETESDDYDLTIAQRDLKAAMDDLYEKTSGFKVACIVVPIGNDFLHIDNLRSETTAGTRVDSDSRYHKIFEAAVQTGRWMIERAKQRAPRVVVIIVPANHDRIGAFTVGRVLEAMYAHDPQVAFDNKPPLRKYFRWGKTLLGYTHGNEEKHADLPLIMAQERPEDWAATVFRLWRIGHFHKKKQTRFTAGDSFHGVEVRVLRSLSATDAWHYSRGYVKERRAMEAFLHHPEDGEVGAFVSKLPEGA